MWRILWLRRLGVRIRRFMIRIGRISILILIFKVYLPYSKRKKRTLINCILRPIPDRAKFVKSVESNIPYVDMPDDIHRIINLSFVHLPYAYDQI